MVLLDCQGEVLKSAELGYVWKAQLRDVTGDGVSDIVIEQQTGSGTGLTERQTAIYSVIGDTIGVLWSGVTFQGSYQGEELGGAWEMRAEVVFPKPGRIEMRSNRFQVEYDPKSQTWKRNGPTRERHDVFVFDRAKGMFLSEEATT